MAVEITCRFTTPTGEYPGAYHADFFSDGGLLRASRCDDFVQAATILGRSYRGPDADGVGLTWEITETI